MIYTIDHIGFEVIDMSTLFYDKVMFSDTRRFLPTLTEIRLYQKYTSAEPDVIQILTEGPTETRELAPIFIITGLNGFSELEKMAKHLLYPTYCTVIPKDSWTIENLAKVFVKVSRVHFITTKGFKVQVLNVDLRGSCICIYSRKSQQNLEYIISEEQQVSAILKFNLRNVRFRCLRNSSVSNSKSTVNISSVESIL